MKRVLALLLIFSFCFALFSCGKKPEENTTTEPTEYVLPTPIVDSDISLPYTSADSFNPYSAKSEINRYLIPVQFEGLFYSVNSGKGEPILASGGEIEGTEVDVKLSQGTLFSDGTELIATDVKASFEKAKNSVYYSTDLKNVSSVTVVDNYTLRFNLSSADAMALNALSFPIVKESGKSVIGTGKYVLKYLEETPYFAVNKNHRNYTSEWNKQIALFDMAGVSSPVYPFKANEISLYLDNLSDGKYVNLSAKTVSVPTTNFVYAGLNMNWSGSVTSLDWVRRAINIGINRTGIAASSYLGQSEAVSTPFKRAFYQMPKDGIIDVSGNTESAVNILKKNGYTTVNSDGVRVNSSGGSLRVSILVCSDNKYKVSVANALKSALETLGFGVTINEKKKAADFVSALKEGHYSIYIGEIKLGNDYDLSEFFTSSGSVSYGIKKETYKIYTDYKSGKDSITPFIENFYTNVPFLPLFYRKTVASVNPNISGASFDKNDLYASVSDWKMKK